MKYYAVRTGKNPGIYTTWTDCEAQVKGFKGAEYKSFATEKEALVYINGNDAVDVVKDNNMDTGSLKDIRSMTENDIKGYLKSLCREDDAVVCFVDGSFNKNTDIYGAGVILYNPLNDEYISLKRSDNVYSSMRNVAGEILAATTAMMYCATKPDVKKLIIYYDYAGIEHWSTGSWKTNNENTRIYKRHCNDARKYFELEYHHVDGHSGVIGNEIVDMLAKAACGVE